MIYQQISGLKQALFIKDATHTGPVLTQVPVRVSSAESCRMPITVLLIQCTYLIPKPISLLETLFL